MLQKIRENRLVLATGARFILLAVIHIPNSIYPHAFDKNGAPEFVTFILIATLFGAFILLKPARFLYSGRVIQILWVLVGVTLISTIFSSDPIASLTGDTGRHAGLVSLFCLLVVAIFHSQFSEIQIKRVISIYLFGVWVVSVIGIFQYFKFFTLPGDVGVTSTLGNQDFFAALLGTTFPLIFFVLINSSIRVRVIVGLGTASALYSLWLAGRRQAYVDIAITLIVLAGSFAWKLLPKRNLSLNARSAFTTIAFVIWIEGIFLMPFLGKFIPVLGNDAQVKIRGQFWVAALNTFLHNPIFGVGPDQYGNFYEQYRTIDSVKLFPTILSNDAHSATVQSLATLGIVGALILVLLIGMLIRSFFIVMEREPERRKQYLALLLFAFVFLTNSAISPITIPNKFLFWGISGFVIGKAYFVPKAKAVSAQVYWNFQGIRYFTALALILSLFIGVNFTLASVKFLNALEKHATNSKAVIHYASNTYLPCSMYFDAEYFMLQNQGSKVLDKFAADKVSQHPRCPGPRLFLAREAYNKNDMKEMGRQIAALEKIAPSRSDFLQAANYYAYKVGDERLKRQIVIQMEKVGIIEFTQGKKSSATSASSK